MVKFNARLGALGMTAALAISCWRGTSIAGPATQPSDDSTPQEFVAHISADRLIALGIDGGMELIAFDPASRTETKTAKLLAEVDMESAKLEVAARGKWGKDVEIAVAHICGDNTSSDYPTMHWTIKDDHATGTFQLDALSALLLARQGEHWKIDLAGYRALSGDQFDAGLKQQIALFKRLNEDLAQEGAYPTADSFLKHEKEVIDKFVAG